MANNRIPYFSADPSGLGQTSRGALSMMGTLDAPVPTEEQSAQFEHDHPFAPSGSLPPPLRAIGGDTPDPTAKFALTPARRSTAPTQRFRDPASGSGVSANPSRQTVPQNAYDAVGGVGTPSAATVPKASMVAYQGWDTGQDEHQYDLSGAGGGAPASAPRVSGDALALSSVLGGYGPQTPSTGRGRGQPSPLNAIGDTGQVLEAAQGLDALHTQSDAQRQIKLLGMAGALPNENDTPEVRANKLGYLDSRVRQAANGQTARAPGTNAAYTPRSAGGNASYTDPAQGTRTVGTLAAEARQKIAASQSSHYVNLGVDSYGRPIEGTEDRNGNLSKLTEPKEDAPSALGKLVRERDAWRAQGRTDVADQYDQVISSYGTKVDLFGNTIGGNAQPRDPFDSASDAALPVPKTRAERDALPPGSKYTGPDGGIHTVQGKAQSAQAPQGAPAAKPALSDHDQQALKWASENPHDPRTAAILSHLGRR